MRSVAEDGSSVAVEVDAGEVKVHCRQISVYLLPGNHSVSWIAACQPCFASCLIIWK